MVVRERTVQAIFQAHFEAYAEAHHLPPHQRKAAWALIHCRTAALGGHIQACPEGHMERPGFLTWQAYYLRLTGTLHASTCPQCGAPLVPRALLPRRVHDPPLPTLASRSLYA
jgi:hypothetical protein